MGGPETFERLPIEDFMRDLHIYYLKHLLFALSTFVALTLKERISEMMERKREREMDMGWRPNTYLWLCYKIMNGKLVNKKTRSPNLLYSSSLQWICLPKNYKSQWYSKSIISKGRKTEYRVSDGFISKATL